MRFCAHNEMNHTRLQVNRTPEHLFQVVLGIVHWTIPGHSSDHLHYTNELNQESERYLGLVRSAGQVGINSFYFL